MPGYRKHMCAGVITGGVLLYCLTLNRLSLIYQAELLVCAVAGSLFPDVDIKSKGQRYFYLLMLCISCFFIAKKQFQPLAFCSIISMIPMLTKHRGLFHQVWFLIAMPSVFWMFLYAQNPVLAQKVQRNVIFFVAGCLSHILLDRKKELINIFK